MKIKKNESGIVKSAIIGHVQKSKKEYIIVTIFFIIGIFVGSIYVNNLPQSEMEELSKYINNFVLSLTEDSEVDKMELLKNSILQNIIISVSLWFIGITLIGLPLIYVIVAFRGFCLSYTVSSVIAILGSSKGLIFVSSAMLLHNIIFIPIFFAIAVSGINVYKTVMKEKNKENIKFAIMKHSVFTGVMSILLLISSFIEVYISTEIFVMLLDFIK